MICAVVLPKMPPRTPVPCAVRAVGLARAGRAAKLVGNILPMPSNLCSAVDKAVRSQFWADFAQTEICHGACTRRRHRHIAGSSRARRSMPANLGPRDRWLFSTIGNILPLPPLEDRSLLPLAVHYMNTCSGRSSYRQQRRDKMSPTAFTEQ